MRCLALIVACLSLVPAAQAVSLQVAAADALTVQVDALQVPLVVNVAAPVADVQAQVAPDDTQLAIATPLVQAQAQAPAVQTQVSVPLVKAEGDAQVQANSSAAAAHDPARLQPAAPAREVVRPSRERMQAQPPITQSTLRPLATAAPSVQIAERKVRKTQTRGGQPSAWSVFMDNDVLDDIAARVHESRLMIWWALAVLGSSLLLVVWAGWPRRLPAPLPRKPLPTWAELLSEARTRREAEEA
jgi:hypothetical protein